MAIGGKEFIVDYDDDPPTLKLDVLVGSPNSKVTETYSIKAELDTGCDFTFIPKALVSKLKLKWSGLDLPLVGYDEQEDPERRVKIYHAKIIIEGVDEAIIEVGAWDYPPLIGRGLMSRWQILINIPCSKFEIVHRDNFKLG